MRKQGISLITFALFLFLVSWQSGPTGKNYDALWKKVQQYTAKDLPRSALKTVQMIYNKAKTEGNEPQVIKSLLFRISLQSKYQEDYRLKSIRLFEKERQSATGVEKPLLSSLLAQLYEGYFDAHRYEILNRMAAAHDTSLQTLGSEQWQKKIREAYLASVALPAETGTIPLKDFSAILQSADTVSYAVWPTLYDLLAHRAIRYFSSHTATFWKRGTGVVHDTSLLAPASEFIKYRFPAGDTIPEITVLRLFQHLLRLHRQHHQEAAFVDADMRRLDYVMQNLPQTPTNRLAYSHALERLLKQFSGKAVAVPVACKLASVY
ncbi:MAG TPA: hypothetical protein ENJ69_00335, partial [Bacteroidetes bacterium]|nr:hypothetical protein [Bacteroidota bacterium]